MADGDQEITFPRLMEESQLEMEPAGGDQEGLEPSPQPRLRPIIEQDSMEPIPLPRSRSRFRPAALMSPDDESRHHTELRPMKVKMVVKPEAYTGLEDWSEYISHFRDCAELGGWDDRAKALVLAANLRGAARKYYTGLSPDEKDSYGSLVTALKRRFGGEHRQDSWLSKLEMRKRKPGETAADLGDDIWRMTQRAYFDFDLRSQEQLALKHFYRVIDSELKIKCVENRCSCIIDAVDVVERYEALFEDRKESRKSNVRAVDYNRPAEITDGLQQIINKLSNLETRQEDFERRIMQSQHSGRQEHRQQGRSPGRRNSCYRCGGEGHYANSCPDRSERSYRSPNRRVTWVTCYNCGEDGHYSTSCPALYRTNTNQPQEAMSNQTQSDAQQQGNFRPSN